MTLSTILKSKIFTIGATLLAAWLVLSVIRVQSHYEALVEKDRVLSEKVVHMEGENVALTEEIAYGQHPAYLEKEARLKLNMKRPDEGVLFVYEDTESEVLASGSLQAPALVGDMPNYKKWLKYLFGNK